MIPDYSAPLIYPAATGFFRLSSVFLLFQKEAVQKAQSFSQDLFDSEGTLVARWKGRTGISGTPALPQQSVADGKG